MYIQDLFAVIEKCKDLSKDTKKQMYELVRNILNVYKDLDIDNEVYDLFMNTDKLTGYLQAKDLLNDVEIDDILTIDEVEKYCNFMGDKDSSDDEDDDEEDEDNDVPQNINIKVYLPQNWILLCILAINTAALGVNTYLTFKNQSA